MTFIDSLTKVTFVSVATGLPAEEVSRTPLIVSVYVVAGFCPEVVRTTVFWSSALSAAPVTLSPLSIL